VFDYHDATAARSKQAAVADFKAQPTGSASDWP
jgi:hypothetical protein